MSSFQKMVTFYVPFHYLYYISISCFNSHFVSATETHNICIVIAIWAPIVLVSSIEMEFRSEKLCLVPFLWLSHFFALIDSPIMCRCILWILKYGMPSMPLCLVGLLEPSAIWVRLVANLLQYYISNLCNILLYLWDFLFYPRRKIKIAICVVRIENKLNLT